MRLRHRRHGVLLPLRLYLPPGGRFALFAIYAHLVVVLTLTLERPCLRRGDLVVLPIRVHVHRPNEGPQELHDPLVRPDILLFFAHATTHVADGLFERGRTELALPDVDEDDDGNEFGGRDLLNVGQFECLAPVLARDHQEYLHCLMHASDELRLELLFVFDPLREAADARERAEVRPAPYRVDSVYKATEVGAARDIPVEQRTESSLVAWTHVLRAEFVDEFGRWRSDCLEFL